MQGCMWCFGGAIRIHLKESMFTGALRLAVLGVVTPRLYSVIGFG
jgi:hypothetical protein